VKQAGSGHWEFALANGEPLGVSRVLLEGGCCWMRLLPDRVGPGRCWDLLRLNELFKAEQIRSEASRAIISVCSPSRGYSRRVTET